MAEARKQENFEKQKQKNNNNIGGRELQSVEEVYKATKVKAALLSFTQMKVRLLMPLGNLKNSPQELVTSPYSKTPSNMQMS